MMTPVFKEEGECCICHGRFVRYGCNPWPVKDAEMQWCHKCDRTVVLPARMKAMKD